MLGSVLAVSLLLAAAEPPAPIQDNPPADKSVATKADPAKEAALNKRVCIREAVTGSNLPQTSVCKTQREWNELRDESRGFTERMQTQNMGSYKPG